MSADQSSALVGRAQFDFTAIPFKFREVTGAAIVVLVAWLAEIIVTIETAAWLIGETNGSGHGIPRVCETPGKVAKLAP